MTTLAIAVLAFFAAGWQGWVARDQESRQLRAYVGTIIGKDYLSISTDGRITLRLDMKNFGATPAYKTSYEAVVKLRDLPLADSADWSIEPAPKTGSVLTVFPGPLEEQHIQSPPFRTLLPQEMTSLSDGSKALVMWGTIHYVDVFQEKHYTDFCLCVWHNTPETFINSGCPAHTNSD